MKVFITWSGTKSKEVARALREWIPDVLNNSKTWMSEVDIGAGERWSSAIASELEVSKCGILCLTKSNISEPWILFESGALAKSLKDTFVCPYLIDLEPSDIPEGPLAQFQAKRANQDDTLQLLQTLNVALGDAGVPEDRLLRNFDRCWPDLERKLKAAGHREEPQPSERSVEDMVADILEIVRGLSLRTRSTEDSPPERAGEEGLLYFREPGGRGEWLTHAEIEARLRTHARGLVQARDFKEGQSGPFSPKSFSQIQPDFDRDPDEHKEKIDEFLNVTRGS